MALAASEKPAPETMAANNDKKSTQPCQGENLHVSQSKVTISTMNAHVDPHNNPITCEGGRTRKGDRVDVKFTGR